MTQTLKLNKLVDHTNLDANASKEDIQKLVNEAKEFDFNSICIRPNWLNDFVNEYRCSIVGSFPKEIFNNETNESVKAKIGNFSVDDKFNEFKTAVTNGASELDPVINISKLERLKEEMDVYYEAVMEAQRPVIVKPIFSCEILSDEELEFSIAKYSEYVKNNQEDKIKYCYKNSTGFIKNDNPQLLKTTSVELATKIKENFDKYDPMEIISIKLAGGIRTIEDIKEYSEICGERLTHIGTSSGVKIFS